MLPPIFLHSMKQKTIYYTKTHVVEIPYNLKHKTETSPRIYNANPTQQIYREKTVHAFPQKYNNEQNQIESDREREADKKKQQKITKHDK